MSQQSAYKTLSVTVIKPDFTVMVTGVNWTCMSDEQYQELYELSVEYPGLVIRNSNPVDAAMVKFSHRRGKVITQPLQEQPGLNGWHGDHMEIYPIVDSYYTKPGDDGLPPHTDLYYRKNKNKVPTHILLWAVVLPENGPTTPIYDLYGLRKRMSAEMVELLTGIEIITPTIQSTGGSSFYAIADASTPTSIPVDRRLILGKDVHERPIVDLPVKIHGQFLYPMDPRESERILQSFWKELEAEGNLYRHVWQPNDVLLTYNTLHGRTPFAAFKKDDDGEEKAIRKLHRINFREGVLPHSRLKIAS